MKTQQKIPQPQIPQIPTIKELSQAISTKVETIIQQLNKIGEHSLLLSPLSEESFLSPQCIQRYTNTYQLQTPIIHKNPKITTRDLEILQEIAKFHKDYAQALKPLHNIGYAEEESIKTHEKYTQILQNLVTYLKQNFQKTTNKNKKEKSHEHEQKSLSRNL